MVDTCFVLYYEVANVPYVEIDVSMDQRYFLLLEARPLSDSFQQRLLVVSSPRSSLEKTMAVCSSLKISSLRGIQVLSGDLKPYCA